MSARIQSEEVFDALRADILACRLRPSAKVKIAPLCAQFGVSLGAAREALSRLVAEGLVQNEAQRGFFVAPVSAKELHDLTAARIEIETLCIEGAMACGDRKWESQVSASYQKLGRIDPLLPDHPADLNPVWSAAHAQFHGALVAACENHVLLRLRAGLYDESERYRHWCLPLTLSAAKRDVGAEHKRILDAVLARDTAATRQAISDHLRKTEDILAMSALFATESTPSVTRPRVLATASR